MGRREQIDAVKFDLETYKRRWNRVCQLLGVANKEDDVFQLLRDLTNPKQTITCKDGAHLAQCNECGCGWDIEDLCDHATDLRRVETILGRVRGEPRKAPDYLVELVKKHQDALEQLDVLRREQEELERVRELVGSEAFQAVEIIKHQRDAWEKESQHLAKKGEELRVRAERAEALVQAWQGIQEGAQNLERESIAKSAPDGPPFTVPKLVNIESLERLVIHVETKE